MEKLPFVTPGGDHNIYVNHQLSDDSRKKKSIITNLIIIMEAFYTIRYPEVNVWHFTVCLGLN